MNTIFFLAIVVAASCYFVDAVPGTNYDSSLARAMCPKFNMNTFKPLSTEAFDFINRLARFSYRFDNYVPTQGETRPKDVPKDLLCTCLVSLRVDTGLLKLEAYSFSEQEPKQLVLPRGFKFSLALEIRFTADQIHESLTTLVTELPTLLLRQFGKDIPNYHITGAGFVYSIFEGLYNGVAKVPAENYILAFVGVSCLPYKK